MNINAVAVCSSNLSKTVEFYKLLGFEFTDFGAEEQHVEAKNTNGARLMIDSRELMISLIGEEPKPGNHSSFAIEYESANEVNMAAKKVQDAGFIVTKQPWDAFWGQRYAIVSDPDGYKMDLFARL